MRKVLSVILAFIFITTMFSACSDGVSVDERQWRLYSVSDLNDNGKIIAVDEKTDVNPDASTVDIMLTFKQGELILKDKINNVTHMGAYEELIATDNVDDYRIFIDGKEGYINVKKSVQQDKSEETILIMTVDGYDLYFRNNRK